TLLVRKGGIDEGPEGFQPEHSDFWLFPTNFHQSETSLNKEGKSLLAVPEIKQRLAPPPPGQILLQDFAQVKEVIRLEEETVLPALSSLQILSAETLSNRFHYRKPGLWIMIVRVYRNEEPIIIPDSPHVAGCRSWVDLPSTIRCSLHQPVLSDEIFHSHFQIIKKHLCPPHIS
ncbi:MAG: DUF1802 family protein, partial [Planctomycetaceae bacterium]|nr:DUF1802 family protein [Planctomycetaceae bacterium]